ncbi:Retrovirus-related Pol polyprotein from transposon RE1 [Sesamum angolense]|uniref:Retrovirus-related Pol polyprotein from transposon RE1 n=1 Tax=Sesamum angolense TaxID=2727404 RepID=A0AAE1W7B7_9LAMI|nr:Retrovirus-related Pol polyprotein from transposon RE1 [Sesamum angolense]
MLGKNTDSGEASATEQKPLGLPERLKLHGGDHPRMNLVSVPFDERNYLSWSRSIRLALGTKQKLGFTEGIYKKLSRNKDEIEQWERVDYNNIENSQEPAEQEALSTGNKVEYNSPMIFQPRRSTRTTTKPAWLNDFIRAASPDSNALQIMSVTPSHRCFVECICFKGAKNLHRSSKPRRVEESNVVRVRGTIKKKYGTWELVPAAADKKSIGCRWVYKLKLKPDGSIEKYKARIVPKGHNQVEGEDYTNYFALVAKAVTMRVFLSVAVSKGWPIHHLDVNNAFLHGTLDEDIYMEPLAGYEVSPVHVCKLKKSLYGLKQALR